MSTPEHRPDRPAVRVTPRGLRLVSLTAMAMLLGLVLLGLSSIMRGCSSKPAEDQAVPAPAQPPSATPSATPSPSATPTPSASPSVSASSGSDDDQPDAQGMKHTGLTGKGTWQTATLEVAPAKKTVAVHRYAVKVEDGTKLKANDVARQVSGVLNDPRGWTGHQGHSFQLVKDASTAEFTIFLASPGRTQKMCPLDVKMTWSCRSGNNVLLNTDRWLYMTPTYTDLTAYRAYMVNHEVGHFIGKDHVGCPAKGRNAPVMMQQSKRIDGCKTNPWPTTDGK
ncbi:DUF3152 domain-containing protein [Luteococcus japonicus]|nr:DUF3152 domain-containing protein [Luteococcus japonicus]